ncbi:MAG: TraR/DksA C4-type zinc finger protein [Patescibacteria group bacterium]
MQNTERYKEKLTEELKLVESELMTVGRKNPENPADWEAVPDNDIWKLDEDEVADKIDGYETNTGILKQLEIRYNEIKHALKRIEDGSFGICTTGGEQIEEARLEANPAATTCVKHME